MDKNLEKFREYVDKNYNLEDDLIKLKYYHTLRVVELMTDLVNRLNLSDDDKRLAIFIALFHDLGRFYEVKINKQFSNVRFDHANSSNVILFDEGFIKNFPIREDEYEIVRRAIHYHNKFDIGDELNERERFFAKLIRDVDKIDILKVVSDYHLEFNKVPTEALLDNYYKRELIDVHNIHSYSDKVIFYIAFYYQLYFDESKDILDEKGYMEDFIRSVKYNQDEDINKYLYNVIDNYKKEKVFRKR